MENNTLEISFDKTKDEEYELPCINCDGKTYHKVLSSINVEGSNEIDRNFSIEYWEDYEELFPSRMLERKKLKNIYIIPFEVRRIYEETYKAIPENLCILGAIGIRSLIEAICIEKDAKGNNLQNKIDNITTMGILTKDASNILHSIRLLGNVAVHEVNPPSINVLNTAFEIVELLIKNVYILPVIAQKIK